MVEEKVSKDISEMNLDNPEEVAEAIEICKKSVMESEESTTERKKQVNQLIQLRIRYQDLMDRLDAKESGLQIEGLNDPRGHEFVHYHEAKIPGVSNAKKIYCQECCHSIWIYLQSSAHCRNCGFSVHMACAGSIMRQCVAEKIRIKPDFILDICPEKSLVALKFRCVECDRKFSRQDSMAEPRLCDYTGLSFCPKCHWNAVAFTPARIVHNWDFKPQLISQAAKQYLYLMYQKPVLNIMKINPKLFAVVQELGSIRKLRCDIILMKKYLVVCRIASEKKLLLSLSDRQHFVDDNEHYSLQDLVDTNSGELTKYLQEKVKLFSNHIKKCILCTAKGFVCEICDEKEIIFSFDEGCSRCDDCQSVFHRECWKSVPSCPKCARKRKSTGFNHVEEDESEP